MNEIWKDIKLFKGIDYTGYYQVSNLGNIKCLKRMIKSGFSNLDYYTKKEKVLKIQEDPNGYPTVRLQKDKQLKSIRIHQIVATFFIPNPHNKPTVNHINAIKGDNRVSNLEWATYKENNTHAWKLGLYPSQKGKGIVGIDMLDLAGCFITRFDSIIDAYIFLGKKRTGNISEVIGGTRNKAYGFKWRYTINEVRQQTTK